MTTRQIADTLGAMPARVATLISNHKRELEVYKGNGRPRYALRSSPFAMGSYGRNKAPQAASAAQPAQISVSKRVQYTLHLPGGVDVEITEEQYNKISPIAAKITTNIPEPKNERIDPIAQAMAGWGDDD